MAYYGTGKTDAWAAMKPWLSNSDSSMAEPPSKLNQISPQQRGYRDGWRAPSVNWYQDNAPYRWGTWAYNQWLKAFLDARIDRAAGNTQ